MTDWAAHFALPYVDVSVSGSDEIELDIVGALERRFAALPPRSGNAKSAVTFDFRSGEPRAIHGEVVYESSRGVVAYEHQTGALEVVIHEAGLARWVAGEPRVEVVVDPGSANALWAATRPLFTVPLLEVYRRAHVFPLHASCVSRHDGAILTVGPSGAGKTTLALALAEAGFTWHADDTVLLDGGEHGRLDVVGLAEEADVADETIELLPGLRSHLSETRLSGYPKQQVARSGVAAELRPWVLIVSEVTSGDRTSIEPLAAEEAFRVVAQSALMTDRSLLQENISTLSHLVIGSTCLRVSIGREGYAPLAERIGELAAP